MILPRLTGLALALQSAERRERCRLTFMPLHDVDGLPGGPIVFETSGHWLVYNQYVKSLDRILFAFLAGKLTLETASITARPPLDPLFLDLRRVIAESVWAIRAEEVTALFADAPEYLIQTTTGQTTSTEQTSREALDAIVLMYHQNPSKTSGKFLEDFPFTPREQFLRRVIRLCILGNLELHPTRVQQVHPKVADPRVVRQTPVNPAQVRKVEGLKKILSMVKSL